ncbi:hypothetical protein M8J75_009023 [Diaphorina citri]|nr:hypothetical protein M8J75_009023 [Diaphorina citri]
MHKKIKTLKCNQCGAAFKDKKAFADHLLEHKGILSYKCNVCDERYPDEESLKQHTLLHTEEIKFVCNLCDQQFSDKFQLSKHYLIHTERDKSEVTVEKYHQLVHQFVMSDNDANDEAAADDDHYVGDDHTPGEPSFDEDSTQATSGSKILNNEGVVGNSSYYQQVNNYLYFNENQQPIYQHNNQYNQSTVTQTYDGFVMTMNQNGHQGTSISISALPLSNTSNNIQTYQPAETKQYENQAINKSSDGDFVTPSSVARYDCSVCKKKYRHKKQLIHHFQQSHSNYYPGGQTGDYSEVICCDICNKVFSSKSSLEEHKEQHHSSAKQTSPSSPRQSKAKKNFIKQKIVLRKGQQFKCNRCSLNVWSIVSTNRLIRRGEQWNTVQTPKEK